MCRTPFPIAACLLAAVFPTAARASGPDPMPVFGGFVDVRSASLEVFVRDSRGFPVTGLGPEDFRILVDGQAVELTHFLAVEDGRAAVPGAGPGSDAPLATAVPPPPEISRRLNLAVVVDLNFTDISSLRAVAPELRRFLARALRPGDRVMVATILRRPHVLAPFTEDHEVPIAALDALPRLLGRRELTERDYQGVLERLASDWFPSQTKEDAEADLRAMGEQQLQAVRGSWSALRAVIDAMAAGIPGRKAVLHVSDGIPLAPYAAELQVLGLRSEPGGPFSSVPFQLRETIDHARAHEVTLYSLDAGGVTDRASGPSPAELRGWGGYGLRPEVRVAATLSAQERTDALRLIALETGGLALARATPSALRELERDLESYYSLGYTPPDAAPGTEHRIEVEVSRPRTAVRHRRATRTIAPRERMAGVAISALIVEPPANPLGVAWRATGRPGEGEGGLLLPVAVTVPARGLALVPDGDGGWSGRLRLFLVGMEHDDRVGAMRESVAAVTVPGSALDGDAVITFHTTVPVTVETSKVAVTVFDEIAEVASSATASVEVGTAPADAPSPRG